MANRHDPAFMDKLKYYAKSGESAGNFDEAVDAYIKLLCAGNKATQRINVAYIDTPDQKARQALVEDVDLEARDGIFVTLIVPGRRRKHKALVLLKKNRRTGKFKMEIFDSKASDMVEQTRSAAQKLIRYLKEDFGPGFDDDVEIEMKDCP